jgi:hypothetical protein
MRSREEVREEFQKLALERKKRREKVALERKNQVPSFSMRQHGNHACMEERVTWLLDGG